MTDKVLCPWCGREMEHIHIEPFDGCHGAWFKCGRCGAMSPTAYSPETKENAIEAARAAALRRYEPPIRPLMMDEVYHQKYQNLFTEYRTDFCSGWEKASDLRLKVCLHSDTYGETWRCWPREPTDEEREAYEWEDEKE